MISLADLKKEIIKDGIIDSEEVNSIKKTIYSDGKIDEDEANFLFDLNDACGDNNNAPEWKTFFIDTICSYLLDDEHTPGKVDSVEASWLIKRIQGDGKLDDTEKSLLKKLREKATAIAPDLQSFIEKHV